MNTPVAERLAVTAAEADPVRQVRAFTIWVADGRKVTQTGRITLADARELVGLLATGDQIDPKIGDRVFRTKSSEELRGLTTVVAWAKASRLVRVTGSRLVPVKRNAGLLERPLELWARMFEVFPQLGTALCPSGWSESLLGRHFDEAVDALLITALRRGGTIGLEDARTLAWGTVTEGYALDDAADQQRTTWRKLNDRDLRLTVDALERLRAVRPAKSGEAIELTELARWAIGRSLGMPQPGDPVFQVRIVLEELEKPPVWRRLLVPADIRLDRLHEIIQAAMGWQNYHLHVFSDGRVEYGVPDLDLPFRDERSATLRDLAPVPGARVRYTYDFGDGWDHQIEVERLLTAEPGVRYPACADGSGTCPPEDCGGTPGYSRLLEILADAGDDEHDDMLAWLGIENAAEFDPSAFDKDRADKAVAAVLSAD